jgi:hypothetical protein
VVGDADGPYRYAYSQYSGGYIETKESFGRGTYHVILKSRDGWIVWPVFVARKSGSNQYFFVMSNVFTSPYTMYGYRSTSGGVTGLGNYTFHPANAWDWHNIKFSFYDNLNTVSVSFNNTESYVFNDGSPLTNDGVCGIHQDIWSTSQNISVHTVRIVNNNPTYYMERWCDFWMKDYSKGVQIDVSVPDTPEKDFGIPTTKTTKGGASNRIFKVGGKFPTKARRDEYNMDIEDSGLNVLERMINDRKYVCLETPKFTSSGYLLSVDTPKRRVGTKNTGGDFTIEFMETR